jgi:hypothetical protein
MRTHDRTEMNVSATPVSCVKHLANMFRGNIKAPRQQVAVANDLANQAESRLNSSRATCNKPCAPKLYELVSIKTVEPLCAVEMFVSN